MQRRHRLLLCGAVSVTVLVCLLVLVGIAAYQSRQKHFRAFTHVWRESPDAYQTLIRLMNGIDDLFTQNGIRYTILFGSLLGYARDKRIIPWDDDFDIGIHEDDLGKLQHLIGTINGGGGDGDNFNIVAFKGEEEGLYYKIYDPRRKKIDGKRWSWPFVDVFTYSHPTPTTIWLENTGKAYPFKQITRKSMEGGRMTVNVVEPYTEMLDDLFPDWINTCVSSEYNHREERVETPWPLRILHPSPITADCQTLMIDGR